jgi:acyl dehydratase
MEWLNVDKVLAALAERFAGVDFAPQPLHVLDDAAKQQTCIRIAPERLLEVMTFSAATTSVAGSISWRT